MTYVCFLVSEADFPFPSVSVVKNPPTNARDIRAVGSIPRLGRSLEEGKGYPLQYFGLENSIDCCKESDMTEQLSLSKTTCISYFLLRILLGMGNIL